MVAQYKINEKVILTDSGGTRNLFVDGAITFNDSDGKTLTVRNTKKTLSPDFFTNYFGTPEQGSARGYRSGGDTPAYSDVIDKFPFTTDANATDVGNLTQARGGKIAGQSSSTHGYTSGGFAPPTVDTIDKFTFSTDANATDVGNLTQARYAVSGQSSN